MQATPPVVAAVRNVAARLRFRASFFSFVFQITFQMCNTKNAHLKKTCRPIHLIILKQLVTNAKLWHKEKHSAHSCWPFLRK